MLPRLRAEESLLATARVAVGTRPSDAARDITRDWERTASDGRRAPVQRLTSPDALPLLGIGYRLAPTQAAP